MLGVDTDLQIFITQLERVFKKSFNTFELMKKLLTLIFSFACLIEKDAIGQGCSDAGFSSAGSMQIGGNNPIAIGSEKYNVNLSLSYAAGEQNTTIFSVQPEWNWAINKESRLQFRLPYTFVSGNLGQSSGLGDPVISYSLLIKEKQKLKEDTARKDSWLWLSTIGGRFGINDASYTGRGQRPLPMTYQTSLGTYDIIFGLSLQNKDWHFAFGFQQPLVQNNFNAFVHDSAASPNELKYFQSGSLWRKSDVMFRMERNIEWKDVKFTGGVLPIYHLGRDRFTDSSGRKREIEGSEGLTLNVNLKLNYKWTERLFIGSIFGMPLMVRDERPDGLTRSFVSILYLVWRY
jgi:hypothetical protein